MTNLKHSLKQSLKLDLSLMNKPPISNSSLDPDLARYASNNMANETVDGETP